MPVLVGKPNHFILDRRAVARPRRADLAGVHGRAMEIGPNQRVDLFVGIRNPTRHLGMGQRLGHEREWLRRLVPWLDLGFRIINRPTVEASRCPGLEAFDSKTQAVERLADARGCALSGPATWCLRFPRVHDGLQKRTRRENHSASEEACVAADTHTDSALLAIDGLGENLFDQFLAQIDVWVFFDLAFDIELIRFLIGLSPG